ncbi:hypothetical protein CO154_00020 [Candidatus Pacearchaeota archaeon CG_4_9_14_3_um_filter_31_7]|nr:MAG: hypothetical protein AUJ10_00565 [Candidatus Pacearchaeota archaeon CG1_02_31_27]PIN92310.1 MAG: hypothetical protein COU55_00665 [Candidatus Pacearchaeota archaeon CG10_big_fil_rev_8_21_14_0_10_31_59]PJA70962.1 MAG: hypothetical protein CO154_00020 [Candidatus Pacearchaeota archaeon CG_4_9_14_3_um_filter_31_7]
MLSKIESNINRLIVELKTFNNIEGVERLEKKGKDNGTLGEIEAILAFAKIKKEEDKLIITPKKQENEKGDFYIEHNGKEYYFEIFTILSDGKLLIKKLEEQGVAGFSENQLPYTIIEKYIKQFKNKKSLVINYNNHFNITLGFHLGFRNIQKEPQRTILSKLFSTTCLPSGYHGLFHKKNFCIRKDEKDIIKLHINFLSNMNFVFAVYNKEVIQGIKNPYTKDLLPLTYSFSILHPNKYKENETSITVNQNLFDAYTKLLKQ